MYKLNLPETNTQKMSTKDRIVNILSKKWPLTTKKMYNIIKKRNPSVHLTYQAVHKSIKELLEVGVIVHDDTGYRIDTKWIENLKRFVDEISEEYYGVGMNVKKVLKTLDELGIVTLKFTAAEQAYDFWTKLEKHLSHRNIYNMCNHDVYPILMQSLIHEMKRLKVKHKKKFYQVLGGKTNVDKWVSDRYNEIGDHSMYGVKEAEPHWTLLIVGDYIFEDFMEEKLKKQIWGLFENIKSPSNFNGKKFYELIRKPTKYIVRITKNPEIANMYKKKIRKYLKKEKTLK